MAETVIARAGAGVAQHLVGLGHLTEALHGLRVAGVHVGMQLAGEPAEGLLDLGLVGAPVDSEHLVVVTFGSHASSLEARALDPAALSPAAYQPRRAGAAHGGADPCALLPLMKAVAVVRPRPWPETWPAQPPRQRALGASPESS